LLKERARSKGLEKIATKLLLQSRALEGSIARAEREHGISIALDGSIDSAAVGAAMQDSAPLFGSFGGASSIGGRGVLSTTPDSVQGPILRTAIPASASGSASDLDLDSDSPQHGGSAGSSRDASHRAGHGDRRQSDGGPWESRSDPDPESESGNRYGYDHGAEKSGASENQDEDEDEDDCGMILKEVPDNAMGLAVGAGAGSGSGGDTGRSKTAQQESKGASTALPSLPEYADRDHDRAQGLQVASPRSRYPSHLAAVTESSEAGTEGDEDGDTQSQGTVQAPEGDAATPKSVASVTPRAVAPGTVRPAVVPRGIPPPPPLPLPSAYTLPPPPPAARAVDARETQGTRTVAPAPSVPPPAPPSRRASVADELVRRGSVSAVSVLRRSSAAGDVGGTTRSGPRIRRSKVKPAAPTAAVQQAIRESREE